MVSAALDWLAACISPPELSAASALLRGAHDGAAVARVVRACRTRRDTAQGRRAASRAGLPSTRGSRSRLSRNRRALAGSGSTGSVRGRLRACRASGHPSSSSCCAPSAGRVPAPAAPSIRPCSACKRLLGEFGASDDVAGPLRVSAALAHLRDLAAATAFEPQEIAAPLLVIDPDTALGMHFDAIWVCGLDAARWPPPANPDPFLPREWQARQGMPGATAELTERQARRTLQRLLASAATALCSVPRFEDEAPLLPSALVADLPRLTAVSSWPGAQASTAQFAARPVLETLVDGSLPAFALHEVVKGGTRLLELQAACPFRAAVELRLGGVELEHPATGIAATERGKLAHAVLHAFWDEVREQAALLAMTADQRVAIVRTLVQVGAGTVACCSRRGRHPLAGPRGALARGAGARTAAAGCGTCAVHGRVRRRLARHRCRRCADTHRHGPGGSPGGRHVRRHRLQDRRKRTTCRMDGRAPGACPSCRCTCVRSARSR